MSVSLSISTQCLVDMRLSNSHGGTINWSAVVSRKGKVEKLANRATRTWVPQVATCFSVYVSEMFVSTIIPYVVKLIFLHD